VITECSLYAIYDADGSLAGELRYLIDKFLGRADCALCDLSHGWHPAGKRAWRQQQGATTQLSWLHRDEVPHHVLVHVSGSLPCIAMDTNGRVDILISKDQLAQCDGDLMVFEQLLARKLEGLASEPIPAPEFN
jgi:hypothetical protein